MRVDAFASQVHYAHHIVPIFEALGAEGEFYVTPHTPHPGVEARALRPGDTPTMVAGYPDLKRVQRPIIFVEHGVGENYGLSDPHYSGGDRREKVMLFICPNQRVADANSRYDAPSVVVGSPRVEWLAQVNRQVVGEVRDGRLRVAVSFHWNCRVHPQAQSALFSFQPYFKAWMQDERIEIRGHAHPRIAARAKKIYPFPFIETFEEVVGWADVYAVDNSSTLFEAAALGLDVVVLDSPYYTAEETGFRFWKYADIGPRISPGDDFVEAAIRSHRESDGYSEIRHRMVTEIFGPLEGSAQRAAKAIRTVINGTKGTPSPADPGARPTQSPIFG